MAEASDGVRLSVPGLEVEARLPWHAATLRYFDPHGSFAAAVAAVTGTPLPAPLTATILPPDAAVGAGVVLAWLRPTEALALSGKAAPIAQLKERLADAAGGHVVELSGGLKAFRVRGSRLPELLGGLGGMAVALRPGEARRGRLADVPVLALSVRAEEVVLVADRTYAAHLGDWIDATLADWRRE
jgi:hypothetical protein